MDCSHLFPLYIPLPHLKCEIISKSTQSATPTADPAPPLQSPHFLSFFLFLSLSYESRSRSGSVFVAGTGSGSRNSCACVDCTTADKENSADLLPATAHCSALHPAGGAVRDRHVGFVTAGEKVLVGAPQGAALGAFLTVYCTQLLRWVLFSY